jgi:L-idonate 5-dehydrogenase
MNLPSESLGVVVYAANDLRVEPVPLSEPAADETIVEVATAASAGPCPPDVCDDIPPMKKG